MVSTSDPRRWSAAQIAAGSPRCRPAPASGRPSATTSGRRRGRRRRPPRRSRPRPPPSRSGWASRMMREALPDQRLVVGDSTRIVRGSRAARSGRSAATANPRRPAAARRRANRRAAATRSRIPTSRARPPAGAGRGRGRRRTSTRTASPRGQSQPRPDAPGACRTALVRASCTIRYDGRGQLRDTGRAGPRSSGRRRGRPPGPSTRSGRSRPGCGRGRVRRPQHAQRPASWATAARPVSEMMSKVDLGPPGRRRPRRPTRPAPP